MFLYGNANLFYLFFFRFSLIHIFKKKTFKLTLFNFLMYFIKEYIPSIRM